MTSGDMYIGVPVMDFCFAGTLGRPTPLAAASGASFVGWSVLFWRAMTLAAPKSTYLMIPLWSSRMSRECVVSDRPAELDECETYSQA